VHGLAFLHLDGKFDASDPDDVAQRVRGAVHALLTASGSPQPGKTESPQAGAVRHILPR
jgi:hypothetical protein